MSRTNHWMRSITTSALLFITLGLAVIAQAQPSNTAPFDHTKTGFLLRDVHATLRCEQCHVDGIFKNTPKECVGCHSVGSRVAATPKPVNHVQTELSCGTCHNSSTTFLVKSFKHVGITSNCASCHNKQSLGVVSKPVNHFPTLLPCESCHTNTNTFTSWKMNHTGITSGCASCHSGQFSGVVSKPAGAAHIATTAPCETCHTSTTTFLGARFDHSSTVVANVCKTCHSGQVAGVTVQPAVHIPTGGAQCDICHTQTNTANFKSFLGGNYDHVGRRLPRENVRLAIRANTPSPVASRRSMYRPFSSATPATHRRTQPAIRHFLAPVTPTHPLREPVPFAITAQPRWANRLPT